MSMLERIDRQAYLRTSKQSVTRYCAAPKLRVRVTTYWVSSPAMSEGEIEKLVAAGWDQTEEPGTRGRTRSWTIGAFPYFVEHGQFVFANKEEQINVYPWWNELQLALHPSGDNWSDSIGPTTESPRGGLKWVRKKSHWQAEVVIRDERRPLRQLIPVDEPKRRDLLLARLTEVYPPYGEYEGRSWRKMVVLTA